MPPGSRGPRLTEGLIVGLAADCILSPGRGILVPKLTPLAKRGLWHAGMRRARLQAGRGAGSLAMQARPAGAHGHQMLRREAERRVRGPVLQGVAARATTPGRDGGDRGTERLHRAAARRMHTSHQKSASWRRAPRTKSGRFGGRKDARHSSHMCIRSAISRPTVASLCSASSSQQPATSCGPRSSPR